jgi:hypothetical protein
MGSRRGWRRLQHQRRHRADEDGLRHALGTVTADVAGDFAAARGVTDVNGVAEIERRHEGRESSAYVSRSLPFHGARSAVTRDGHGR